MWIDSVQLFSMVIGDCVKFAESNGSSSGGHVWKQSVWQASGSICVYITGGMKAIGTEDKRK